MRTLPAKILRGAAFGFLRLLAYQFPGSWRLSRSRNATERHVRRMLAEKLPMSPVACSTKHGFKLIVQPGIDKGVERSIWLHGTYEEGTLAIFSRLLRAGDVALDVGANIGLMTLHAACLVGINGKVFSFEPMPDIFAQLQANIALNRLAQVHAFPLALGAAPGALPIFAHPEINRGSSSLIADNTAEPAHITKVVTLDEFVSREVRRPIRLIKVDVEGWELEVLKGAKETLTGPNAPILCVECSVLHPMSGGSVAVLFEFIKLANYRCFVLKHGKGRPSPLIEVSAANQLPQHDNLFCFPVAGCNAIDVSLYPDARV